MADVEVTDGPGSDSPSHAAPRRRGRTALVVTGVVAAIVLAAAAGAAAGRATAPGPDIVVAPGPVLEESPQAEPLPVGVASGPPSTAMSTAPATQAPPQVIVTPGQPTDWPAILTASPGLSDTATTASGWRLVNSGISAAQVAGALAAVFGAAGAPTSDEDAWTVGTEGAPTVTVQKDPLVSWTFEDPTPPTVTATPTEPTATAPPTTATPTEPTPPMTPDRALELGTLLLGSIGVDPASVDWQVDRLTDGTQVTAWQLVAGARTQLAWRVHFDPAGRVIEASGFSAGFEEVPGYSVVGAATAVERSGQPEWTAIPPLLISGPVADAESSATPTASSSQDLPVVSVPVLNVTVTGADLGLAQYWQPDGGLLILPAYRLAAEDGSNWSLLAVGDEYVSFVNQPYPTSETAGR